MATVEVSDAVAFFISPIGDDDSPERENSNLVRDHILRPALVPSHVSDVVRADGDTNPGEVTPAIVRAILEAKLVVADLSGANPNVYYELAIAHAFQKPTIHIARPGELPRFDIKDSRVIRYGTVVDQATAAQASIANAAAYALTHPESRETPVSRTAELVSLKNSGDPAAEQIAYLAQQVNGLTARVDRALRVAGDDALQRLDNAFRDSGRDRLLTWAKMLREYAYSVSRHPSLLGTSIAQHDALDHLITRLDEIEYEAERLVWNAATKRHVRTNLELVQSELMDLLPGQKIPSEPGA